MPKRGDEASGRTIPRSPKAKKRGDVSMWGGGLLMADDFAPERKPRRGPWRVIGVVALVLLLGGGAFAWHSWPRIPILNRPWPGVAASPPPAPPVVAEAPAPAPPAPAAAPPAPAPPPQPPAVPESSNKATAPTPPEPVRVAEQTTAKKPAAKAKSSKRHHKSSRSHKRSHKKSKQR
jgi:hypothetical protein